MLPSSVLEVMGLRLLRQGQKGWYLGAGCGYSVESVFFCYLCWELNPEMERAHVGQTQFLIVMFHV